MMTRMPLPSGSGRLCAAPSMSCRVSAATPDTSPAAAAPPPTMRNLRRLNSAILRIPLRRKVFRGVDRGRNDSLGIVDEVLERGDGAIGPSADADQVTGCVDAVARGGVIDGRQVTKGDELVCCPHS